MNFFANLKSFLNLTCKSTSNPRRIAAGMYDAGTTVQHLAAYWADASDDYSDRMADSASRSLMRARARKESVNNGYAVNAIRSFGNHVIGRCGPQVRLLKECGLCREEQKIIEMAFWKWQRRTHDVDKLRSGVRALMYDGEAFQRFIYDSSIPEAELNVQEIEAKRVDNPYGTMSENQIEGIVFEGINPVLYYIQKRTTNPFYADYQEYEPVPADHIMHLANKVFPEQKRGVPIMGSVLRLMADQQLYEAYTLEAAKAAAKNPMYLFSESDTIAPPGAQILEAAHPGEMNVLASGWRPYSTEVKFPTQNYTDYDTALTQKQGAGVGTPLGQIQCNTSNYNYSAWRGEKQGYWVTIGIWQEAVTAYFMIPRLANFIQCHATFKDSLSGKIAQKLLDRWEPDDIPVDFRYEQPPSVDPEKDRKADQIALQEGLISRHMICARDGIDYDDLQSDLTLENAEIGKNPEVVQQTPSLE